MNLVDCKPLVEPKNGPNDKPFCIFWQWGAITNWDLFPVQGWGLGHKYEKKMGGQTNGKEKCAMQQPTNYRGHFIPSKAHQL